MTDARLPDRLGPYRIIRELGSGSMGRVLLAREDTPPREVALKLLRSAALPAEFEQRFQREIELLGRLEHPGIARLYAAGTLQTDQGSLPYLAMEYVDGTDLCTHAGALTLDAKLRLLATLARAVHYAHTRGIVHRDLKPANILVGADGQPRILDFGVAHVSDSAGTQMTLLGQVLGTVPYMSPEQLGGHVVDPRSDVYALGCIAYEIISGRLPHPGIDRSSVIAAAQTLMTQTPARLSRWVPATAGDVETLVHKAMAFEAAQRYQSAAELAADIERVLAHQPITARPPTAWYVARLFVRRHRALSAGVALALAAIVTGAGVSLKFALDARTRLAELTAVTGFLEDMLVSADPGRALGREVRVTDAIDAAERELSTTPDLPRSVAMALRGVIGRTRSQLGNPAGGLPLLQQVLADAQALHGPHSDAARLAWLDLADVHENLGDYAKALESVSGPAFAGPLPAALRVRADNVRVTSLTGTGDLTQAVKIGTANRAFAVKTLGADADLTLEATYDLIVAQRDAGEYAPAIALARELLAGHQRRHAPEHPHVLASSDLLGTLLELNEELEEAEQVLSQTLKAAEKIYGADHYLTGDYRLNLALVLGKQRRYAEAVALIATTRAVYVQRFGRANTRTLAALNAEATYREELGELKAAEAGLREILDIQAELGVRGIPNLAPRANLGTLLMNLKRFDEANAEYRRVIAQAEQDLGAEHPLYGIFLSNQGWCLGLSGQRENARRTLEAAIQQLDTSVGAEHPAAVKAKERLAKLSAS